MWVFEAIPGQSGKYRGKNGYDRCVIQYSSAIVGDGAARCIEVNNRPPTFFSAQARQAVQEFLQYINKTSRGAAS